MLPKEITITPLHFKVAYDECEALEVKEKIIFDQVNLLVKHCPLHVAFRDLLDEEFEIRGPTVFFVASGKQVLLNFEMIQKIVKPFDESIRNGERLIPSESQTFNILETSWTPRYGNISE